MHSLPSVPIVQILYQYGTNLLPVCTVYRQSETVPTIKLKKPNHWFCTSSTLIVGIPSKALTRTTVAKIVGDESESAIEVLGTRDGDGNEGGNADE